MDNAKTNLQSMYTQAKQAGMRVVAVTIQPTKGAIGYWNNDPDSTRYEPAVVQKTIDLNDWIMNEAADIDARVDIYSIIVDPNDPGAMLSEYAATDNLHMSVGGHEALADAIYATASIDSETASRPPAPGCSWSRYRSSP